MLSKKSFTGRFSKGREASFEVDPNTFKYDTKGFSALIDVHSFDPKEISVKTIDHTIVVECKRSNTKENEEGMGEKRFVRKFNLPNEYDMSAVKSTLSRDGILQLQVPKPNYENKVEHHNEVHPEKPSFLMSLLSNRANSMLRRSHSIPSDNEEELCDAV